MEELKLTIKERSSIQKFEKDLKRMINKEKRDGYGGLCMQLEPYNFSPVLTNYIIKLLKLRYSDVEYCGLTGLNMNGCKVGKLLSLDFK